MHLCVMSMDIMHMGGRHVFAARMKSAVGTAFIASAAASGPGWSTHPPQSIGLGGRDEYGPYLGFRTLHRGVMVAAMKTVPTALFILAAKR
jgi:hypothetical protein